MKPILTMSNRIYSTPSGLQLEYLPRRARRRRQVLLCVALWLLVTAAVWFLINN